MSNMDRRHLLRLGGALSVMGTGGSFALQLAAASSAAGQAAADYKALVCIFLNGGNDSNNTVLATDSDSWGRYFAARNVGVTPIALMPPGAAPVAPGQTSPITGRAAQATTPEAWGGVLPITPARPQPIPAGTNASTRTFALHPHIQPIRSLFEQRRLAILANVGPLIRPITKAQYLAKRVPVPPSLFSHNDQQSTWQALAPEGAHEGWGGRFADNLASMNGANTMFTAISPSGDAVFLCGRNITQYQITSGGQGAVTIAAATGSSLFGSALGPARLRDIIQDENPASYLAADYAATTSRSITTNAAFGAALGQVGASVTAPPPYANPVTRVVEANTLATHLQAVARMIATAQTLGLRRQVFFVSLGGWDTHDSQNTTQPNLLGKLAHAMSYFDATLANLGGVDRRSSVTTFTASDFSRGFTSNGDGTDHAWGGHHLIMGGAVRGGDIYGQYPTLGVDIGGFNNPDMVNGALIPTTSVEQYAATLGAWFGVGNADLDVVLPNRRNFGSGSLGFV